MYRILALLFFVPGLVAASPGQLDELYSVGYQVEVTIGDGTWSVRSTSRIRSGGSIDLDLGHYRVSLTFGDLSESNDMTVLVTDMKSAEIFDGGVLNEDVRVSLNSITEFDASNQLAIVRGVVAIGLMKK